MRTIGSKPGREAWVGGIQDPDQASDSAWLMRVSISDVSLVTSGSYQRFYEVDGVRQDVVDEADACVEIPQHGTKHSLNVSVSVGIVLWQLAGGA